MNILEARNLSVILVLECERTRPACQPKMDGFLRAILALGWVSGCSVNKLNSTRAQTQSQGRSRPLYKRFSFYYAISLVLSQVTFSALFSCFRQDNFPVITVSEAIIRGALNVAWFAGNILRRLHFVWNAGLMLDMVNRLKALEASRTMERKTGGPKVRLNSFYIVYLLTVVSIGTVTVSDFLLQIWMTASGMSSAVIHPIVDIIIELFDLLVIDSSKVFSNGLVLLVGNRLLEHYRQLISEFLQANQQPEEATLKFITDEVKHVSWKQFMDKISCVERLFALYNKLIGLPLLVMIFEDFISSAILVYKTLMQIRETNLKLAMLINICNVVGAYTSIYLTARVGQQIRNAIMESKAEIRLQLAKSSLPPAEAKPETEHVVGNYLLQWNWKMNALGLFSVDNRLFAMVFGIGMTYITFLFQLKISEDTTNLKLTGSSVGTGN